MSVQTVAPTEAAEIRPKRELGLWLATALVIGNMIGSGVFLLPASLASYGGISIVGWLFTAVGAFLLAYVFSRLARGFPAAGGPYAYSRRAFGDFVGFQTAWGYWLAAWIGNAAIATAFVGYLAYFWTGLGGTGSSDYLGQALVAVSAVIVLTFVNVMGVRQGGLLQAVMTVGKLIPLVAIGFVAIFWFDTANWPAFNPDPNNQGSLGVVGAVAALTLWAFIGLESATIPAENVKDPERNIPRATLYGVIGTAVVYILGTVAVMGILSADTLGASTAPFADAARSVWGDWAGGTVAVAAILSTFGCLNGWILLTGQMPYAAARDRLFPTPFARLNRRGAPAFAMIASSVLLVAFIFIFYNKSQVARFNDYILLATTTTLIAYLYGAAARMMLLVSDRKRFPGRMVVEMGAAVLAVAYAMWTIFGAGYRYATWGVLLTLAGLPVYIWLKWETSKQHPELVQPEYQLTIQLDAREHDVHAKV
jgi:APA family basic amino acid/polyamine antiporter